MVTAAVTPKADIAKCHKQIRAVQPTAPLFDRLVGKREQVRRHGDPERLGSLKVDDQLEFGRLLDAPHDEGIMKIK